MTMPANPSGGQNTAFERHKVGSAKDTLRIAREAVSQKPGALQIEELDRLNAGCCQRGTQTKASAVLQKFRSAESIDHAVNFEITPENRWPERHWLKNNRWGGIEYTSMVEIRTGPLHRRARMDVARYLVARARPTVPRHN
jgi:hypothetical protein